MTLSKPLPSSPTSGSTSFTWAFRGMGSKLTWTLQILQDEAHAHLYKKISFSCFHPITSWKEISVQTCKNLVHKLLPLDSLSSVPKNSTPPLSLSPLSRGQFLEQNHHFHPNSLFAPWTAPQAGPRAAAPRGVQWAGLFPGMHRAKHSCKPAPTPFPN